MEIKNLQKNFQEIPEKILKILKKMHHEKNSLFRINQQAD